MKVKIRNVLILLLGILVFGTILCSNRVNAEDVNSDDILNMIPNNIELGIPESEYEKSETIILEKIKEILTNNGIQCDIIDKNGNSNNYILLKDKTYNGMEARVFAGSGIIHFGDNIYQYGSISTGTSIKYVNFLYNKKEGYSIEDEEYVKNLKLQSPGYYGIDIKTLSSFDYSILENIVEEYYTNLIDDNSIVVKAFCGQGGGNYIATGATFEIGIIKNGILYDVRQIEELFIPVINVQSSVDDKNLDNYVKAQIQEYYKGVPNITKISKGIKYEDVEVVNGYTIYFSGIEDYDFIIINREEEKEIKYSDKTTNIKLETDTSVVPEDTTLIVEKVTTGDTYNTVMATLGDTIDKFVLYDINLKSNGVKIQPNGKVKISIPVPEGFSKDKLVVYRISDNEKIKYDVKVETVGGKDYATFETDHFSLYALALDNGTTNNESKELDETPKTGNVDISLYAFTAIAIISLAGIIIAKKNNK